MAEIGGGEAMSRLVDIVERAARKEYGNDSGFIGKLAGVLLGAKFDSTWGPFICGALGAKGADGLHEGYIVCPCYGADVGLSAVYMRKGKTGPGVLQRFLGALRLKPNLGAGPVG